MLMEANNVSWRNTRAQHESALKPIARKGQGAAPPAFPHKHAHTVCSSAQLNREKGSPEGRRPFGRVKGQRPLRSPINTRILYAVATNSIAKKGVQRVEDPLAGSRGSAPCASLLYLLFLRESREKSKKMLTNFTGMGMIGRTIVSSAMGAVGEGCTAERAFCRPFEPV